MKKFILFLALFAMGTSVTAQRLLTWTPEFPLDNSSILITVDCTKGNQGLLNYEGGSSNNVYVHVGVITNLSTGPSDWKYTKFTWGTPDPAAHATALGGNKYYYTINNPRTFFGVPAGETIKKICVIFRTATGSLKQVNSDNSDMYIPVYGSTEYAVRLNLPPFEPRYIPWIEPINVAVGGNISITGVASASSNLTLKLDGTTLTTATSTTISNTPTISTACGHQVMLEGNNGSGVVKDSFSFFIAPATTVAALPAGMQEGINYDPNNTSATLVLYAPNKTNVVVIGDFTNWAVNCAYQMKRTSDGNYYWLTLTGLTPGTEYAYQYLIDNSIRTADPYTQKILDPNNDQFISAITYPNLKPYPAGATDIVGILQTAEPQYTWQVNSFNKPDKRNLMIYELLIRDFTAEHSYQSLIDSLQYLKNTGINAIELMPINEFDGNESWGYNPDFYFAPDKYYGPKNKLKEFIDKCHLNGIAVILDVVYNHCTGNAPQAKMYWNAATSQPAANNPWLNVVAPHPYSVFNDFNHTSTATQYLVSRSLNFWLDEYKVDGFRFDLAKGFTQTVTNTTTVENYDPSRVANLKRYYDAAVPTHPNTYMILEFLGTLPCQEEQEYVGYGFMCWGNDNFQYSQCTMGFTANSDLSQVMWNSSQRNYPNPGSDGYMESHDEERTMYRNLTFGNSSGSYNVRDLNTALAREEAAAAVFFTAPGPKQIWQFEERGYDISISFGGGNTANKPPHWEYMNNPNRRHLYDTYNAIMTFRLNNQAVFNNTTFGYDLYNGGGLYKLIQIADPNAAGTKVTVVANLDVTAKSRGVTFQATGNWTNLVGNGTGSGLNGATGSTFNLASTSQTITLQPGEYHIYVSGCATAAPTATTPVNYCQNAVAVPLTATGTNLLWYTVPTGGTGSSTAPTPSTTTVGSTTYYVSQTIGCEGPRLPIVVNVAATPAAPTVTSPVTYCQSATAVPLTASGTNLLWYTVPTGGTGSAIAPTPSTATAGSTTYYVSQTLGTCEGPRASIIVNVNPLPAAPGVTSPIAYCQNATAVALTATGANLLWYTVPTGGTGSATAPIPSTATAGSTTYYVSQTVTGCEGPRASIVVNVTATPLAPGVTTPVSYCQNATAVPLTATGIGLLWYTAPTGGTGSVAAPTPSTATVGSTTYYVSQTVSGCESPRSAITVIVNAIPAAPGVTTPVNYCQNAAAVPLTASGSNLLWYTAPTGGTGSPTAPTPSTTTVGSTIYYVSQTTSGCESPRASITVNVNAIPAAPVVSSPVVYCQNATAVPLTATGSNLLWYTVPTGGTGSATAPTPSTTTVGNTTYYVSQSASGCESPRASITVTINALPVAPGVTSPVSYCQNATAVPLTASGSNLLWYTVPTGGTGSATAPTPSTASIGSTNYYVSQTVGGCEGPRATIVVTITATTPPPTVVSPVNYCQNATAVPLTATGTSLLWYTVPTGGTGSATAPTPSTAVVGTVTYYVSQTQSCGESPRASIDVVVSAVPAAPTVSSPVVYCQNATATALTATGSNLLWYTVPTGGTGSATAPTPSTTTAGSTTYYVSQTVTSCESPRASIVVNIIATPAAPTVTSPVTYCQNSTAVPLTATGSNLLWYTVPTGGTGSATAPTPSTTTVGSTTYYVSQTVNGCEGPRASIVVTINAIPAAPTVTSPVNYCQNSTAAPLTATGSNLLWYTVPTGGTGSATAPTPSTTTVGSTTYYVSQTVNGCESPRASITVNVNAIPAAPGVSSPISYCQNATAVPLTATGTNLLWYTVPTGGTGSATAPTPSTTTVGSNTYYVSQTVTGCESPRASITVNINAIPAAPGVTSPVNYCQNATAVALTATGSNLLWYTVPTGGTGSATAPTPSTTTVGSTTYYVSQTVTGCESPRAAITVNVAAPTPAPTVVSPVSYCQNATAVPLTATGTGLLWYTVPTGGTGSATAPTPSTTTPGSTTWYVSQTGACGESPRAAITVNVLATPAAPGVTSPVNYCRNATAVPLNATGTNLLWYAAATGGTGSATAPTPSTATVGSTTYYVSQTVSTCESPRSAITVIINAIPNAPTVSSTVNYCQNAAAVPLTATGTNLLWYTVATGGTGSATAPTPSTAAVGSISYYVSQTTTGCESPRAVITVTVSALAAPPTVTTPITYCQNVTATALTATGNGLLWYTVPTGGTGSATAPTPVTTTAGSFSYYVSQSNGCGEGPRAAINVVITPTPGAPAGLNVTSLTSNSVVLNWSTSAGIFYTVDYKASTSSSWINVASAVSSGTVSVTGLAPGTTYDWRVSANCSSAPTTNYTAAQFSTISHNNVITNIKDGFGIKITPDPVIGNAIIDFIIPGNGLVRISVLNPQGQLVKTLFTALRNAGQYTFNVTNQMNALSHGTYFLRVEQYGHGAVIEFLKQ